MLLNQNPRLVDFEYSDTTPLMHATGIYSPIDNRNQIVQLLLERGADPNAEGWRALSSCIYSNDAQCIQLLLERRRPAHREPRRENRSRLRALEGR